MRRSKWLWIFMMLMLACGLVLVGCNDDDDDDDAGPVVAEASADDGSGDEAAAELAAADLLGNWTTPNDPDGASRSFSLGDGGEATFTEDLNDPMSPGIQVDIGTWSLAGDTLSLHTSIGAMDGSGTVQGGNTVVINGRTYTK
jgi:hypothetical protein